MNYQNIKTETQKLPTIGSVTWWAIREVQIRREEMKALFQEIDIPEGWLPPEITNYNAFKKAINKIQPGSKYMFRDILHSPEKTVWGVVKEEKQVVAETLDYNVSNKLILWGDGRLEVENPTFPADIIGNYYSHFKETYVSQDIRKMLLDVIQDHFYSTAIREAGGVYFILDKFTPELEKLEQLIPKISPLSKLYILGIVDAEKTKNLVFSVFKEEIQQQIVELFKECNEIDTESVQERTITNRLTMLNSIEHKIKIYSGALGTPDAEIEDLKKGIELLKQRINAIKPARRMLTY